MKSQVSFPFSLTIFTDVSDVCMDDRAVSSNAIVSMLLDGTVVKDWCKKTFLHITRSLRDICIHVYISLSQLFEIEILKEEFVHIFNNEQIV